MDIIKVLQNVSLLVSPWTQTLVKMLTWMKFIHNKMPFWIWFKFSVVMKKSYLYFDGEFFCGIQNWFISKWQETNLVKCIWSIWNNLPKEDLKSKSNILTLHKPQWHRPQKDSLFHYTQKLFYITMHSLHKVYKVTTQWWNCVCLATQFMLNTQVPKLSTWCTLHKTWDLTFQQSGWYSLSVCGLWKTQNC